MKLHRVIALGALIAVLAPAALQAQEPVSIRVVSRGMLGIMTEPVPANDVNARQRLIVDVVPNSAAARAGVMRGDTIIAVNGLSATRQLMDAGFQPGDTAVLRIRRDGRQREIRVVAEARPAEYRVAVNPVLSDSVRGRISVIMDAVRANADTLAVYVQRFNADSTWAIGFGDSGVFRISTGVDTVFYNRANIDSVRTHVLRMTEELPRFFSDSMNFRFERAFPDSTFFRFGPDSLRVFRPAEVWASSFSYGARAVAGAELSELNPGLDEYFGTDSGVLVLDAREGTPAARAGMQAGDVIVRANGLDVGSIAELRRAIESAARGSDVELSVLRRGRTVRVDLRRE